MREFEGKDYKVFDMFNNRWGLVTAGDKNSYNTCTIAWGSLGTIWGGPCRGRAIVTVYVHPDRYTYEFLRKSNQFTVSFFPDGYQKALGYLGSHSGRDEDKISVAGLTPAPIGDTVTFKEANLTFVCRKLYEAPFDREGMADEINNGIYASWEPHWMFVGEIIETEDKRERNERC